MSPIKCKVLVQYKVLNRHMIISTFSNKENIISPSYDLHIRLLSPIYFFMRIYEAQHIESRSSGF